MDRISPGLISAAARGIHPLFDTTSIRRAFSRLDHGLINEQNLLHAHEALSDLVSLQNLIDQQIYLGTLPEPVVELLVFLYFRTVDQFLEASHHTLH